MTASAFAELRYKRQLAYLAQEDGCKSGDGSAGSLGDVACMPYGNAVDCAFDADRRADLGECADTLKDDLKLYQGL